MAKQAISARGRLFASNFGGQIDRDAFVSASEGLSALVKDRRMDFECVRGALGTAFMGRGIENMQADAIQRFEFTHAPMTNSDRESRRDALNAANLRWLLEEMYPGKKALIWAHNVHVMNAYYDSDFHGVHLTRRPGDIKPTGVFTAEWLGRHVYTLE